MVEFKYQMHCHTTPCSHCGRITPFELVNSLYKNGYSGAVITNHFYNGNTGIDRELSWRKFVSFYEKDYLEAKRFAEPLGVDILFGVEEHLGNGQEILCYGLTPEILYMHPELKVGELELWYNTLSPLGVIIVQAHPFRVRNYICDVGVMSEKYLHGIEVYNYGNDPSENDIASEFAERHPDMIVTSGADAHLPHVLSHAGISVKERITSSEKLAFILKSGDYTLIKE